MLISEHWGRPFCLMPPDTFPIFQDLLVIWQMNSFKPAVFLVCIYLGYQL